MLPFRESNLPGEHSVPAEGHEHPLTFGKDIYAVDAEEEGLFVSLVLHGLPHELHRLEPHPLDNLRSERGLLIASWLVRAQ